jgi:hypothetical protein
MKRRWFQIHLSTAIVLMFVASGMLWLQFLPTARLDAWVQLSRGTMTEHTILYGWPQSCRQHEVNISPKSQFSPSSDAEMIVATKSHSAEIKFSPDEIDNETKQWIPADWVRTQGAEIWLARGIIVNALTCLAVMFGIGSIMEFSIRRREARKP